MLISTLVLRDEGALRLASFILSLTKGSLSDRVR